MTLSGRMRQRDESGFFLYRAGTSLSCQCRGNKKEYLTFDDGPCESTAQILDILQEYQVPAAFFVIAREEEELIPLYRRIVEEGHVLANHTATHVYEHVYASF